MELVDQASPALRELVDAPREARECPSRRAQLLSRAGSLHLSLGDDVSSCLELCANRRRRSRRRRDTTASLRRTTAPLQGPAVPRRARARLRGGAPTGLRPRRKASASRFLRRLQVLLRSAKVALGGHERQLVVVRALAGAVECSLRLRDRRAQRLVVSEPLAHQSVEHAVPARRARAFHDWRPGIPAATSSPVPPDTRPSA